METKEIILKSNSKKQTKTVLHTEIAKYLKPHQVDGIKFMFENCYEQNSGCILAHCMGLGKTLQVIALLHCVISLKEYSTNKILVLCPISTIINWKEEIVRWLAPINDQRKLQIYELEQKDDINRKISYLQKWSLCDSNTPAGCLIMGYEAFRNLVNFHSSKANAKKYKESQLREIQRHIEKYLLKSADIVICDEGHIIKNLNAAITLAVNQIKTGTRIILTGTPIQNHLIEYYSMVNFVKPSFLGTKQHFNEYFAEPIKNGQHADSCPTDIKYMKERSYALNKKLSKIVQRREISLLKDFLPEKFEFVLFVPLTETQYKLYKYFLDHRGGSIEYKRLFGDYTCLRKIWTHLKVLDNAHQKSDVKKKKLAKYDDNSCSDDDDEDQMGGLDSIDNDWWRKLIDKSQLESALSSHKITILFEILKECKRVGDKCVIFSSFVQVLNVVEFFMNQINQQQKDGNLRPGLQNFEGPWIKNEDYYRLDGSVPKDRRHTMIKNFNDDNHKRTKVFLISAQAGGQGINLFGANRLILLDTSWNPARDQQSIFRIYRMGQTKHCYVYRLLSMGTMEEKIYSRSVTKQAMSCRVVDKQQIDRHYSMNELYELYSLTKTNIEERPLPILPKDDILAQLLQKHPDKIYKYLEHDSLLENKVEEALNDVEKNEAWKWLERNSQGQSLQVTSVELQQQIFAFSSQNPTPTIGLTVKTQNEMESNIFEFNRPVAVLDPKTYNSLVKKDNFSANTIVEMDEFSEQLIDGRHNAGVDTCSKNGTNSLIEPLGRDVMEVLTAGRVLNDFVAENAEVNTDFESATNSFNELSESDIMGVLTVGRDLNAVVAQNADVDTCPKNATQSLVEPLGNDVQEAITAKRVLNDVVAQNAEVDTDFENVPNSFNEPFGNDVINEECLEKLSERQIVVDRPYILTEKIDASTSTVDFKSSEHIAELQESLNAEFQEFDEEKVGERMTNSLSTFAKGVLHTLNIRYAVPLQQHELQNALFTIERYSEEACISSFNRSKNFEYKVTFKRPLNCNDQQPVKKLKLSLEIDPTASVTVDQAMSTLPLIMNDRILCQGTTFTGNVNQSDSKCNIEHDNPFDKAHSFKDDNLRIEDVGSESVNTNDVEPTSKLVERTSKNVVSRQVVESMLTSQAECDDDQASLPNPMYLNDDMTKISVKEVEISSYNIQVSNEILALNGEQSTSVSMSLTNSLDSSSAEDVEMNYCIPKSSIIKDNINDLLTNYEQLIPNLFKDEEILKQSNVGNSEQESLLPSDKHESVARTLWNEAVAENSFEDETMSLNSQQRSEESEEESIDETVRDFDALQKSSIDTTYIETPVLRCVSEFETSSDDERDLENYFESHSRQEVHVYEGSNLSNEQHSILSTMKRVCVLM